MRQFSSAFIVVAVVVAGLALGRTTAQDHFDPCFADERMASFVAWLDRMNRQGIKAGDANVLPVVPVGRHAGTFVPDSCFAVEGATGDITLLRRPFDGEAFDSSIPVFIADPGMEARRIRMVASYQKASFSADLSGF